MRIELPRSASPRAAWFGSAADATGNPLAVELLGIQGVAAVLLKQEVAIVSRDGVEWEVLLPAIEAVATAWAAAQPAAAAAPIGDLANRVQQILDSEINPAVAGHGGWIRLERVEGNDIFLTMGGGCQGCSMAAHTLREGVCASTCLSSAPSSMPPTTSPGPTPTGPGSERELRRPGIGACYRGDDPLFSRYS